MSEDTITDHRSNIEAFYPDASVPRDRFDMLATEALFGWREISDCISPGQRCLEIGAGAGLLSALASQRADNVTALEPLPQSFSFSTPILDKVEKSEIQNLTVIRQTLEDYEPDDQFDLIWSINVFEHLDDWKTGILKTKKLLRDGGRAIILCPNYAIPYESHYGIPIIANKDLTQKIFAKHISEFDQRHQCPGLWDSINMISVGKIVTFAHQNNVEIDFDHQITERMFERFMNDPHLRGRHGLIGTMVSMFHKMRLHKSFSIIPVGLHPYVAFNIYA